MRRSIAAAMLIVTALVAPGQAQEAPVPGQAAPAGVDPGPTASTPPVRDIDAVIASIRAGKTNLGAIQSLSTVGSVDVVRIGELAPGGSEQALEAAISENQAHIAVLQGLIEANPDLKAELAGHSVAPTEVVAAHVEADGSLTVFAR